MVIRLADQGFGGHGPAGAESAPAAAGWYELVYGRTRRLDRWWRVTPAIPDIGPWLGTTVRAVVDGGSGLDRPRLLLAQDGRVRMVGIACRASLLSHMNTDTGAPDGRALYTFVGWVAVAGTAAADSAFPQTPDLPAMAERAVDWAKPVYDHWVGLTWDETAGQAKAPRHSEAKPAPWAGDRVPADVTDQHAGTPKPPVDAREHQAPPMRQIRLLPERDVGRIWSAELRTTRPVIVTAGWQAARSVPRASPMFAGVAGLTAPTVVDPIAPAKPTAPEARREERIEPADRSGFQERIPREDPSDAASMRHQLGRLWRKLAPVQDAARAALDPEGRERHTQDPRAQEPQATPAPRPQPTSGPMTRLRGKTSDKPADAAPDDEPPTTASWP